MSRHWHLLLRQGPQPFELVETPWKTTWLPCALQDLVGPFVEDDKAIVLTKQDADISDDTALRIALRDAWVPIPAFDCRESPMSLAYGRGRWEYAERWDPIRAAPIPVVLTCGMQVVEASLRRDDAERFCDVATGHSVYRCVREASCWRVTSGLPGDGSTVDLTPDPATLPQLRTRWPEATTLIDEAIALHASGRSWIGRHGADGRPVGLHLTTSIRRQSATFLNGGFLSVRWQWQGYDAVGNPIAAWTTEGLGQPTPPGAAQDGLRHQCRYLVSSWYPW